MTIADDTNAAFPAPARTLGQWDIAKGLAWREWLAWGGWFRGFFCVWLVCTWVLMIFFHPGFILVFGCLYAMAVGLLAGASEPMEGSEEFALSLPPTRSQRFLVSCSWPAGRCWP